MTPRERGFLLLCSHLGDPARKPLTVSQFRILVERMGQARKPSDDRELVPGDLVALGYGWEMARRIAALLEDEAVLDYYLQKGERRGCVPVTRVSEAYPLLLRRRLGLESPACLWARGDLSLLAEPAVSLVGSRELRQKNRTFAAEVGRQAALQGYVLISGNARGADRTAQESCLAAGGKVIAIVADSLWKQPLREDLLYLSEEDYDEDFSAQRALSRNRCIHALGTRTFVAQSALETGGTWDGTAKNLRFGWSDVFCFDDGTEAAAALIRMGAEGIGMEELDSFYDLQKSEQNFLDR